MDPLDPNSSVNPPPPPGPSAYGIPGEIPPAGEAAAVSKDARLWATFTHASAFLGLIGIPLANVIAPLVLWLWKRQDHPFVDDQGKEAVNFQITVLILGAVSILLFFVLIGIPMLIAVWIGAAVFTVIGSIKANDGVAYRYPFSWRLIK